MLHTIRLPLFFAPHHPQLARNSACIVVISVVVRGAVYIRISWMKRPLFPPRGSPRNSSLKFVLFPTKKPAVSDWIIGNKTFGVNVILIPALLVDMT